MKRFKKQDSRKKIVAWLEKDSYDPRRVNGIVEWKKYLNLLNVIAESVVVRFLSKTLACFIHLSLFERFSTVPSDAVSPNLAKAVNCASKVAILNFWSYSSGSNKNIVFLIVAVVNSDLSWKNLKCNARSCLTENFEKWSNEKKRFAIDK